MKGQFHRDHVHGLSAAQWNEFSSMLEVLPARLMPHDVGMRLGIDYKIARAILLAIARDKLGETNTLIYHTCTEAPVGSLPMSKGFPRLPWTCPNCEKVIRTLDELSFDMNCVVRCPIDLV